MAETPTKPLFCARFSILNVNAYTAAQIVSAFRPALEAAGYTVYQAPLVKSYVAKYRTTQEGPFEGDDAKSVYLTFYVMGPDGKETAIAKDLTNDPKGTRPIIEAKKATVTTVAWNLGPPSGATTQSLSDLLWQIRREKLYSSATYTGGGWTPIVLDWTKTPLTRPNYPNRPPLPSALKPVIAPKPAPKPTPLPIVPAPAPAPILSNEGIPWKLVLGAGAGVLAVLVLTSNKSSRRKVRYAA